MTCVVAPSQGEVLFDRYDITCTPTLPLQDFTFSYYIETGMVSSVVMMIAYLVHAGGHSKNLQLREHSQMTSPVL